MVRYFMRLTLVTVCLSFATQQANAEILRVPEDFALIQAAIAAATDGDEVVVGPGVFNESLNYLGKDLIVRSVSGPAITVLDGLNTFRLVNFTNNEPSTVVLEGFTLRNGTGSLQGGAVRCLQVAPTFRDCIFSGNESSLGGAVAIIQAPSTTRFEDCTFENNTSFGGGGAVYVDNANVSQTLKIIHRL